MPRMPKPTPLRQNRERRDYGLVVIDGTLPEPPAPTTGWLLSVKAEWVALWSSPLVQVMLPLTDAPGIRRLFGLRDERERMMREVRKSRMVKGSEGQPRPNPLYGQVVAFDAEIRQLEDRFGLSARSRLQLGISLGKAQAAVADMNAGLAASDGDAAEADLLLAFAEPAAAVERAGGGGVDGGEPRPRAGRRPR